MEIMQIVAIGLVATIFAVFIKQQRPEMAVQLSIATGVIIFLLVIGKVGIIINTLEDLANKADINVFYLTTVLKIVGIAYVAEFGSQICKDAGEGAIASKIEFAAKVIVMVMAIPIIVAILESILRLLP